VAAAPELNATAAPDNPAQAAIALMLKPSKIAMTSTPSFTLWISHRSMRF
jgi:hypothetical protein